MNLAPVDEVAARLLERDVHRDVPVIEKEQQ
jgi:hypothetical protein